MFSWVCAPAIRASVYRPMKMEVSSIAQDLTCCTRRLATSDSRTSGIPFIPALTGPSVSLVRFFQICIPKLEDEDAAGSMYP